MGSQHFFLSSIAKSSKKKIKKKNLKMAGCSPERTCNYIFWEIHRMWMFVSALVLVGADQSLIANTSQQVLSLLFNVAFVSGQCPSTKPARCQMKNCCSGSLWSQMVKLPNRISLNQAFPTHHEHWLPSSPPSVGDQQFFPSPHPTNGLILCWLLLQHHLLQPWHPFPNKILHPSQSPAFISL